MTIDQLRNRVASVERDLLRAELSAGGWNQHATARRLGCAVTTLRRMISRHPKLISEIERKGLAPGRPGASNAI